MKRGGFLTRKPMKRRHKSTGPDAATVATVLGRAGGCCEKCGFALTGTRGVDYHIHHRRPRRAGGSRLPDTNQPQNLVALCAQCHQDVESYRAAAIHHGWLLHANDNPLDRPILMHSDGMWCYLTADGRISDLPPGESEVGWPEDEETTA